MALPPLAAKMMIVLGVKNFLIFSSTPGWGSPVDLAAVGAGFPAVDEGSRSPVVGDGVVRASCDAAAAVCVFVFVVSNVDEEDILTHWPPISPHF